MAELYVHGVVIKEGGSEVRQIRSPNQSVIGMVGTAPASTALKDNVPAVYFKKKAALEAVFPANASGEKGTLYNAVIGIYDQLEGTVVLVKSKSDSQEDLLKAIEVLVDSQSLVDQKPKIILAPGFGNTNPAPSVANPSGGNPSGGNPSGGNPSGGNPSGGNPSGGNPPVENERNNPNRR
jgi:phage tail sheath protein FI